MDTTVQAEIERQQAIMLEKLLTIFDTKIEGMKQQLEDIKPGEEVDNLSINKGDFLESESALIDNSRGCLKKHLHAWKELSPTYSVLGVIKEGYKLQLVTIPQSAVLQNNKSAFDNVFVSKAIDDLLVNQCVSIVESQPWVVNPLSVSVQDKGKKWLILDLRHVNHHLYKYKFKCEDITTAQQLLGKSYFLYTFDIKSLYHHVEIFESH